ncbi:MAG: YdcF family protein [Candidatus Korobacteraceae bacterium]
MVALLAVSAIGFLFFISRQIMREAGVDEEHPADAIVVFGAAEYSGRPSPVYKARLDHANSLFQRGLAPVIITTGGAGNDPHFSEGQVGRDYLESRGVPDANLIAETQGGDTDESAQRVAVILHANDMRSCLLVSDAYHMFRAKQMMTAQGIMVYISPRPGSIPKTIVGRYVAALRESFSYLLYKAHVR